MKHYAGVQLRDRLTSLDQAVRAVRNSPGEIELHDLRVACRRYLQAIRLFAGVLEPKRVRQMRDRLRRLMDRAGAVRNIDVTLQLLASAGVEDADLSRALAEKRADQEDRLIRHLARWRGQRSVLHWRKWLRPSKPAGQPWDREATAAQNAHRVLPRMFDELIAAGERSVAAGTEHELHRLRLLGKRFRYSVELFTEVYSKGVEQHLRQLRALQDRLGGLNDVFTALPMVEGHGAARSALANLLQARRDDVFSYWKIFREQRASWKLWLRGRHGNLRSAPR